MHDTTSGSSSRSVSHVELGGAEVVVTDTLPNLENWGPSGQREGGYAVRFGCTSDVIVPWVFFGDLLSAYAFGRAGRDGYGASSRDMRHAVYEVRFDGATLRDVRTLYLASSSTDTLVSLRWAPKDEMILREWVGHVVRRDSGEDPWSTA